MSDRTESTIVIGAPPSAVLDVIADFEAYPEWTGAVKRAEVLESDAADRPVRALFELDAGAIRDTYTLDYTWAVDGDGVGSLSWTLHEPSTVLKALDGTYELHPIADGTAVRYALAVDLRIPMLGMLRRKAEKVIIDTALNELKKRVERGDAEGAG
jgi:ribosome-associated toxin RatA of RatAB toxin-antitoxin module